MEFGIQVGPKVDEIGQIAHAENLGFTSAWFADSQIVWSDPFICMALAARQTNTIALGTGVAVAGTRIAPVLANAIATINRIAPGRTFLTIGAGHTAWKMMGKKPLKIAELEDYIRVVKALIAGEE